METKSRYEIIAELEEKKASLINQKANINVTENHFGRDAVAAQEKYDKFVEEKGILLQNLDDQLESIEKSLSRFDSQKKQ